MRIYDKDNGYPWLEQVKIVSGKHPRGCQFHKVEVHQKKSRNYAALMARESCKMQSSYVRSVQTKVENKKRGSYEFWKFSNVILNRGKLSVPFSANDLEVISSLSETVKFFAMNFTSDSMLDDKGHSLLVFLFRPLELGHTMLCLWSWVTFILSIFQL